jgi:hypothetical protein
MIIAIVILLFFLIFLFAILQINPTLDIGKIQKKQIFESLVMNYYYNLFTTIRDDYYSAVRDPVRFYSYSLDVLNLTGDNNKEKVMDLIRLSAIQGIPPSNITYVREHYQESKGNMKPPILSLMSQIMYLFREDFTKNTNYYGKKIYITYNVTGYYFINKNLSDQIKYVLAQPDLVKENYVVDCSQNNMSKNSDFFKQFCNVSLTNYERDADLDGDGVPNYMDCDEDGDGLNATNHLWGLICSNPKDEDDNNDGIPDYLPHKSVGNVTILTPSPVVTEVKLPWNPQANHAFSFDIFSPPTLKVNPYYLILFPFDGKWAGQTTFTLPDEFDYTKDYFYFVSAPVHFYIETESNLDLYDILNKTLVINRKINIGIYVQTSQCDGTPPGC